jgi:hypothetical protein
MSKKSKRTGMGSSSLWGTTVVRRSRGMDVFQAVTGMKRFSLLAVDFPAARTSRVDVLPAIARSKRSDGRIRQAFRLS